MSLTIFNRRAVNEVALSGFRRSAAAPYSNSSAGCFFAGQTGSASPYIPTIRSRNPMAKSQERIDPMTRKMLITAAIAALALTPLTGIGTAEAHGGGFGGGGFHGGGFHGGG